MDKTDTNIVQNTNQQVPIPKKKNVALETVKNILISAGIITALEVLFGTNGKSYWKFQGKEILPTIVPEAIVGGAAVTYKLVQDIKHNKEVDELTKKETDSFTERYKQENSAPAASPSVPSR